MTDQDQGTAVIIGVGAERGTGAAVARRFAAGGLHAVLDGRTQERLEKRRDEIIAAGSSASVHVLDVRKEDEVAALFDAVEKSYAPIKSVTFNPDETSATRWPKPRPGCSSICGGCRVSAGSW